MPRVVLWVVMTRSPFSLISTFVPSLPLPRLVQVCRILIVSCSSLSFQNHAVLQIHSEGGRALARALKNNISICSLNLCLNRLGEEGGRAIFDVLRHHPSMDCLNLAHNALGPVTALSIAKMLNHNKVLKELDISGNEIGINGGAQIRDAVAQNTTLEHAALALSGMTQSDILSTQDLLQARAEAAARQRIIQQKK
jgi:Ran GTPase-activating protein (RanGAP) involved in mRNA processing and transport